MQSSSKVSVCFATCVHMLCVATHNIAPDVTPDLSSPSTLIVQLISMSLHNNVRAMVHEGDVTLLHDHASRIVVQ